MKTRMIIATLLVTLCNVGCKAGRNLETTSVAPGMDYTRTFNEKDFTSISASSIFNITFVQGKSYSIKATSNNQEFLNLMEVHKIGSTLDLSIKNHKSNKTFHNVEVHVEITAPDLQRLDLSAASHFTAERLETKGDFELLCSGATKVTIESLQCNALTMNASGAVKFNFAKAKCKSLKFIGSGAVEIASSFDVEQNANINNSGAVKGKMEINAKNITTHNSGAVNIEMKVNCESLDAQNSGAGTLTITGTADKSDFHNSGVSRINTKGLNRF